MERKRIVTALKAKPKLDFTLPESLAKRRTAAYVRVSTNSEVQLKSYDAQKDYFPKFIASRPNWEFVGLYCDEGLSGTSSKTRPEFNRMIRDAMDGKIDLIVTKSISRFARNTLDTLTTIRQLKAASCEVWFEKENLYSCDNKGEFILTLLSSMAQEESRSLSENVKWGVRKRFADGIYAMPYAHFLGYRRGADRKMEVAEKEAKIVRLIYRSYLEGDSVSGIANSLTNHGIPTPAGKKNWQSAVVESILSNEKYYGAALLQKCYTEDYLTKKVRKNTGELPQYFVENDHDPVVSEAVFAEVQRRMKREYFINPLLHDFSNKLVCGECKSKYGCRPVGAYKEPRPGHARYTSWYCIRRYTHPHTIKIPTVSDEVLNYLFGKAVRQLWTERAELQRMIIKAFSAVMPPAKHAVRLRRMKAFLNQFGQMHPLRIAIDRAAIQVMLNYGEITTDQMMNFHFINTQCINYPIPRKRQLKCEKP